MSPAALYRHFPARADLLDAVAANAFVVMGDYFDRHCKIKPARARLGAITADAVDFALACPNLFKLMYDEARKPGAAHGIVIRAASNLIAQIAKDEPDEIKDPLRPREIAQAWIALIVGAAALYRAGVIEDEAALREMIDRGAGRVLGLA